MKALRKRGVRILPGGDYGFAWTPHGTNAKDLEYFVKVVGMSTMEALLSATAWGGPMMRMGKASLATVREGFLADLLLVDGDPLADITVLQDKLAHPGGDEGRRVPPRAAAAQRARTTRWAPERGDRDGQRPLHQRPHPRRQRRECPYAGSVLVQGNRIRAVGRSPRRSRPPARP